ncbi:hypothetical protein AWM75_05745 [Aerococcus urinaehominis]|uniref:Uncharacterized protein n=2 Tax=Aerococcus urinaehominis TaxID=128944 RepID=A0A0X8FLZ1_9LACT|nr:cyclodeaminase/cyclohydrolase family protein [Aerococcus urinaehominis]AMB99529.1 hypothetical protein AWM75_05745 [Aerococcus urinaehominis]SDM34064.1 Formiminotetrahydrofolate cyclodeaminase [Aerococcus urinaehominis]
MDLQRFMEELASKKSSPGGGAVAPITGAFGVALAAMVLAITQDKEPDKQPELVAELLSQAHNLKEILFKLSAADQTVSEQLFASYGLPRTNDQEKSDRQAAIQTGLIRATETPLATMQTACQGQEMLVTVAEIGRKSVLADVRVASRHLTTALESANENVIENVAWLKDQDLGQTYQSQAQSLLQKNQDLASQVQVKLSLR